MTENRHSSGDLYEQTARIHWQELETHFAHGVVIRIAGDLDLVDVTTCLANDDKATVEKWIGSGQIEHLCTEVAKDWSGRDPELWCVVVAPWVVVQERTAG